MSDTFRDNGEFGYRPGIFDLRAIPVCRLDFSVWHFGYGEGVTFVLSGVEERKLHAVQDALSELVEESFCSGVLVARHWRLLRTCSLVSPRLATKATG